MSHENGNNHTPDSQQIVPAAASELNNLIQIISDTVAMLENIWQGAPESERYFDMLRKSVDRAAKVTTQLVQHVGGTERKIVMHPALNAPASGLPPARTPLHVSRCILVVDDEPMATILSGWPPAMRRAKRLSD